MPKNRLTPYQKKMLAYEKDTRQAKLDDREAAKLATNRITKKDSHKKVRSKIKKLVRHSPQDSGSNLTAASLESILPPKPAHRPQVKLKDAVEPRRKD